MSAFKLSVRSDSRYRRLIGVGGIGSGILLALEGNHDLGRNESRAARLIDARDYCKLHIIAHYLAALLDRSESPFDVVPIGKVGADSVGARLVQEMIDVGVDAKHVNKVDDQPTLFSVCYQYPDATGGNITTNNSAAALVTTSDVDSVTSLFEDSRNRSIALCVPEVPLDVRHYFLRLATKYDAFRVVSFTSDEIIAARESGMLCLVDLLVLNEDEASKLAGESFDPETPNTFLRDCAAAVTASQPEINIIISAGKKGAYGFSHGEWTHSPGLPVKIVSTAGAGDALLAGTLAAMIAGLPFTHSAEESNHTLRSALDFGVLLASYSITSAHTIHPVTELNAVLNFGELYGVRCEGERLIAGH